MIYLKLQICRFLHKKTGTTVRWHKAASGSLGQPRQPHSVRFDLQLRPILFSSQLRSLLSEKVEVP